MHGRLLEAEPGVKLTNHDLMQALKNELNLFRLNPRSDMHVKWMGKMVVVVKFQFLVTLVGKLHQFALVNRIKIHMEIGEPFKL